MAFVVADRVQETSTTTGTGSFTLAGAVTGYRTFSAGIGSGNTTWYCIAHQTAAEWEVGYGTMSSGTVLARTNILSSSNSGSTVNFSAGTKNVFVTLPVERAITTGATGSGVLAPNTATPFTANTLVYSSSTTAAQSATNIPTDGSALGLLAGSFSENWVNLSSGNLIYVNQANYFKASPTGTTAYQISNSPVSIGYCFIFNIVDGGSYTITWNFTPKWASGTAPTLTATGTDVLGFFTPDQGVTWYGFVLGLNVS